MDHFRYHDGRLRCEQVALSRLAEEFGTPLYVYSQCTLLDHFHRLEQAFTELDPLICFSIKSCQNVHILRLLAQRGSGFDVVSGGELYRALQAGGDPKRMVFAGVGKTETEMREGLLAGVGWFNIESESELGELSRLAQEMRIDARAALRINPDVDPHTHVYTTTGKKETKFGVDLERARAVFGGYPRDGRLKLTGLHMHIGSPVNSVEPYRESVSRALELIDALREDGCTVDTLDLGGGFGAFYDGSEAPPASAYAAVIIPLLRGRHLRVILEPGRSISGNAGLLLTRVLHVKESGARRFVIVDASMNELLRPALYGAYHFIWPVDAGLRVPERRTASQPFADLIECDVVGPICESGDFLAKQRRLPPLARGDLLAVFTAGAYAMTMSSQYNSRPRAAEALVSGGEARLIRRRESYADLIAPELDARPD